MNSQDFDRLIYRDKFMEYAIEEARKSEAENGIPIGSILVRDEKIIGRGHNKRIQEQDPIMHAELCCIQNATKESMDLKGTTLYTTHMPCYLCAGAVIQFGVSKVVAGESKTFPHARHILENNGVEVVDLDLDECKMILRNFIFNNSELWERASENNFPQEENIGDDKIIPPYGKQKYFNFYQYPQPIKVADKDKYSIVHKLDLDKEIPNSKEFTLFVSVPYCRSKCFSCPFFKNFITSNEKPVQALGDYLPLMIKQIKNYASTIRFSKACCGAVYIGGGTASLLSWQQVQLLIDEVKNSFRIETDAEITLEGNPLELGKEYLALLGKTGINRLSIGLQSFEDKILKKSLNSPHNSKSGFASVKNALELDFKTVNVDLLYGIPGQKKSDWHSDIKRITSMAPQSITIYRYVVYPNSVSEKMIQKGLLQKQIDEQEIHDWYSWAYGELKGAGYSEKRFGCFVKPGHEQRYSQLSYNLSCEGIGIGAGAYSFINGYVFKASKDVRRFKENVEQNVFQIGDYISIKATKKNKMERYIMHNLFSSVLSRKNFLSFFNQDPLEVFPFIFAKLWRYNLVAIDSECVKLTILGKRYIHNILYEFYSEDLKAK